MANKVFVSPGVFTSEKDLTFVAQSVGVTTLGIVGETTKGPAFDPVFITNYDDFKVIFGGLNTEKFKDTGAPKYQVPYVAKSYLEESNQLFVTRVLGFTGYDAGDAWVVSASGSTAVNGQVLAVIRSRGQYGAVTANVLAHDVTDGTTCSTTGLTGTFTGALTDVKGDFILSAATASGTYVYTVSLDNSKKNYITRVLGSTPTDRDDTVLYVEDIYPTIIDDISASGLTQGVIATEAFENYQGKFRTPRTPYVVSELRGTNVFNLFRCMSIADGDSANRDIKISIINIDFSNKRFDLIIRGFGDTDGNLNVLEQFTKCDVNPASSNFIGKKIGTVDGEYALRSNYIMIEMAATYPEDAFPAGFEGVIVRDYPSGCTPSLKAPYATYNTAYETVTRSIRKEYLGFSSISGIDASLFTMKGFMGAHVTGTEPTYWSATTKGFHMDSGATVVLNSDGTEAFDVSTVGAFRTDALAAGTSYEKLTGRKFTFLPYGGFDGWDVFRGERTNTDNYIYGNAVGYVPSTPKFCTPENCGPYTGLIGNSDYYAYLYGIQQYKNPESININVFATPGINWMDNTILVKEAIEMVEDDRSDSLYVIDAPYIGGDSFDGSINDVSSVATGNAVDEIDSADIDSNYSATFWPWEQINDEENGVRIYLPPTLDVVRNIAFTDNIAFPWFASAGVNRGLCKANRTKWKLTQDDRDDLYEARINPIATFSDTGVVIWGNKTLQVKSSALDRINVRRLLLQARKLISAVATRLLFEQNDEQVRQQFLDLVNPILDNIRQERGLTDFRVTVSSDPIEIDRNELRGKIYIKPTRSLEFIEVEFNITPTGASFDDI